MKRLRLIILFGFLANSLFGQNLNYIDYYTNDREVFSKIDSNYLYLLGALEINSLIETKLYYDTLENIKDSSIVNYYRFDSLGRIVEHRYDYRFESTKYKSISYAYSEDGQVTITRDNPYSPFNILDGAYVPERMCMYCEYKNSSYQIETINVQRSIDGEIHTMRYYYNQDLFVEYYSHRKYLISGLDYLEGEKLVYRHRISYEK